MSEALRVVVEREGWGLSSDAVPRETLREMEGALDQALDARRRIQIANGVAESTAGTAHHLVDRDSIFLHWLDWLVQSEAFGVVEELLGEKVILNSFGAVDNRRDYQQYVAQIHRDVRTFTRDVRLMMQILVMMDDFTPENGATRLMPRSHLSPDRPDPEAFARSAQSAVGRAGQIVVWDSRVWHAAGANVQDARRRALTLTFTRPFFKPQFDYCRHLGFEYCAARSGPVQQVLGYHARVPASLDEWYRPREQRFYRADQG